MVEHTRDPNGGVALVVLSGGQDSVTCLAWARKYWAIVEAVTFSYGQRHEVEVSQAARICSMLGVPWYSVFLGSLVSEVCESALLGKGSSPAIGERHRMRPELPASFVPNRNALLLTLAHALGQRLGATDLITGVCETDFSGYPDCRDAFIHALEKALNLGATGDEDHGLKIHHPLMSMDKADIFNLAAQNAALGLVLEHSHTCYQGDREHRHPWGYGCDACPACGLRREGWARYRAGVAEGTYPAPVGSAPLAGP